MPARHRLIRRPLAWRGARLAALGLAWVAAVSPAHAQPPPPQGDDEAEGEAAPRLIDRATAPLRRGYQLVGSSHRGEVVAAAELRLGAISALGVGYDDRLMVGATARDATAHGRGVAWFRLGVEAHRWSRYQPAMDLAFEKSTGRDGARAAELRVTATERWRSSVAGGLEATTGLGLWELAGGARRLSQGPVASRLRPFLGLAWTPSSYPRTSLLLEGSFGPSLLAAQPRLDWRLGWGARYRAFPWASIDLVVRNRQGAGLAGSTVMVRLSATLE